MIIAIDAMGGDKAPDAIISGVLEAAELLENSDKLILVGPEKIIEVTMASLESHPKSATDLISIIDAPDVIGMEEVPIESLRKKPKSSIAVLAKLAKRNLADAVISAGNTGACVAAFQMRMRNLDGVNRPGIAVVFPTFEGPVTICDVGANIACKPVNLYQYAVMAGIYSRGLLGIDSPRVGLMSIGAEDAKGNEVVKKARELIKSDPGINFIGNIEGTDIFRGVCDVAVCEGFVGNVILKLTEGVVAGLFKAIKDELNQEKITFAMQFKLIIDRIYKKYDYNEYGGAPLLGVDGTAFMCHGASESRTIKNAILTAKKYHTQKINERIIDHLAGANVCNKLQKPSPGEQAVRTLNEQAD